MKSKIYLSTKDHETKLRLLEEDEKCKTCLLEYVNGPKAGTTVAFSSSTIKRWWKEIGEEEVAQEKPEQTSKVVKEK